MLPLGAAKSRLIFTVQSYEKDWAVYECFTNFFTLKWKKIYLVILVISHLVKIVSGWKSGHYIIIYKYIFIYYYIVSIKTEIRNSFWLFWLWLSWLSWLPFQYSVALFFPDLVDSRFPESVDSLPDIVDNREFLNGL